MARPKHYEYVSPAVQGARDLEAMRDIADDVIESDFVPYACLYDPQTIVTKDGELLQILKITGLGYETKQPGELRQAIRRAIKRAIPNETYAVWLHTLRRRQQRSSRAHFPDSFSGHLDEAWAANQPASAFFTNELYITIVKRGDNNVSLRNVKALLQSLNFKRDTAERSANLDRLNTELAGTMQSMLTQLGPYGARQLGLVEREGVYYSEMLEFLEKLINLEDRPMKLPERDLSFVLTSGEITFGYNAMEVRTADDHRRFAAILTVKEYKESTLSGIDQFLEIPCELIVSQCFSFADASAARDSYAQQAQYLALSQDKEFAEWIEIDRLMQSQTPGPREFGHQQTSLFLISPTTKQLETNVKLVQRALGRLGVVAVREDLRFEECYWAQLPANFPFVVRKHPVDTEHVAGFANLQSAPMGAAAGSAWGPHVTMFTTLQDAPYFFNFHREGSGHTVILGKPGTGRTSFTHLLLAQSRKLNARIWYLDSHSRAAPFIKALGGSYAAPATAGLMLNPLQMTDTPANRDFISLWFATLIDPQGYGLNRSTLAFFQGMIAELMKQPRESRRLSTLLPQLREADPMLGQALARFCTGGEFGDLFDMPQDTLKLENITGIDISRFMGNPATRIPLTSYLLHRLTSALDGKPTLIVLDEGFQILDTPLFAPRALSWCDYLIAQNAAAIFTTDAPDVSGSVAFASGIAKKAATLFAFADPMPAAEYALGFSMNEQDMAALSYLKKPDHHVLQKRGTESVVLKLNFRGITDPMRATLSGRNPADTLADLMGRKPAA